MGLGDGLVELICKLPLVCNSNFVVWSTLIMSDNIQLQMRTEMGSYQEVTFGRWMVLVTKRE